MKYYNKEKLKDMIDNSSAGISLKVIAQIAYTWEVKL